MTVIRDTDDPSKAKQLGQLPDYLFSVQPVFLLLFNESKVPTIQGAAFESNPSLKDVEKTSGFHT